MKTTLKELESKVNQLKNITKENFHLQKDHNGFKVLLIDESTGGIKDDVVTFRSQSKDALWYSIDIFIKGFLFKR